MSWINSALASLLIIEEAAYIDIKNNTTAVGIIKLSLIFANFLVVTINHPTFIDITHTDLITTEFHDSCGVRTTLAGLQWLGSQ